MTCRAMMKKYSLDQWGEWMIYTMQYKQMVIEQVRRQAEREAAGRQGDSRRQGDRKRGRGREREAGRQEERETGRERGVC